MSINSVQITPAEEKYAPPTQIIELAVVGDEADKVVLVQGDKPVEEVLAEGGPQFGSIKQARQLVCLSLSNYEEDNKGSTTKRVVEFPAIELTDLIRALAVFGVQVHAWHLGDVPVKLPTGPPAEPSPSQP